jgi:hypothetical protein
MFGYRSYSHACNDAMTRAGFEYILLKHVRTAETCCPTLAAKRVSPHVLRHYLPLRIMSCWCSIAFVFGHFARSSGDIEIGFLSSEGDERTDVSLLSSTTKQVCREVAKGPPAGLSSNPNLTGKADHCASPAVFSPSCAACGGTRLCLVNCCGLCMIWPKIIDPKRRSVPLPDIIRKGR